MSSGVGYLARAVDARIVDIVEINEVKFLPFGSDIRTPLKTVGVRGLSACSVVVLASQYGAIVAHIGPNVLGSTDPRSFIILAHQKMDEVGRLYQQNRQRFPQGTKTYVIFATFGGTPTSQEQTSIFRQRLQALNLPIDKDVSYERPQLSEVNNKRPEGTVWVDGRRDFPVVYLEDKVITPGGVTSSAAGSSTSTEDAHRPAWVLLHGQSEYLLLRPDRTIVQRATVPPPDQWIRTYNQTGGLTGVIMWDGKEWKTQAPR